MGFGDEDLVDQFNLEPIQRQIASERAEKAQRLRAQRIESFVAGVQGVVRTIKNLTPRARTDIMVMLSSLEVGDLSRNQMLSRLYVIFKIVHKAAAFQKDGMLTHKQQNEIEALLRGTFLVHMIYPRKGSPYVRTQNVIVNVAPGRKGKVMAIDTPGFVDMAKNPQGFKWDKFENHQKINRFLGGGIFRRLFVKHDLKDSENPLFYPAKVIVGNGK